MQGVFHRLGRLEPNYGSCTCQEKRPWHAEESNVAKQLVFRIFTS